jgi:predicted permease
MRALHGFGADLKLAARRLLATPAFTLFAIASLAIGVGVTTIVYSIVDSLFWRQLGIRDPSTAVVLVKAGDGRYSPTSVSEQDYRDLKASSEAFESITASEMIYVPVALPARSHRLPGEAVDGDYFRTFGVRSRLGRIIQPEDEREARRVVVLSENVWRKKFQGDAAVVGQMLRLAGIPFEIIGVAAAPFQGTRSIVDGAGFWIPLSSADVVQPQVIAAAMARNPGFARWQVFGRLQTAGGLAAVSDRIGQLASDFDRIRPQRVNRAGEPVSRRQWSLMTFEQVEEDSEIGNRIAYVIIFLAGLVLVVASTNLSNLILARGALRHHEVAVRRALGASRLRLVREQLSESVIIALLGGAASYVTLQVLRVWMTTDFAFDRFFVLSIEPTIHIGTLSVAGGTMLLALLVFGLEPAIQLTRGNAVRGELAAAGGAVGLPRIRRHRLLLRWQVAISAGFFILATMFVRYTVQQITHDPGVRLDGLAMAEIDFTQRGWDEARARREIGRLMETAQRDPRVGSIAVSSGLPFGTSNPSAQLFVPGSTVRPQEHARVIAATPNIFDILGVRVLRGRSFQGRAEAHARPEVVVSEHAARALFGTVSAVGRELQFGLVSGPGRDDRARTAVVVGVARDTDSRYLAERRVMTIYMSFVDHYSPRLTLTARSASASTSAGALEALIRTTSPEIPVEFVGEASQVLVGPYVFLRAAGLVTVGLGTLTLVLAMVGLFGIQSHIVTHRTREIGVRMAFGASAGRIKGMVLKDGYKPVLQGLAMGVFIGLTGRAIVRSYLEADISVLDPWMFFVVPIPLILAAFCACWLPARRASRVEPMVALRHL